MNKADYAAYLDSSHWRVLRARFYKAKGYKRCYLCGTKKRVQLHHRTYKRLGHERLEDLVSLCNGCHEETHKVIKNGRAQSYYAHQKLRKR